MQCPDHPENTTTAFCRNCGKGVCRECSVDLDGVPHCSKCKAELDPAPVDEPVTEPLPRDSAPIPPPPAIAAPAAPPPRPGYADPKAPNPAMAGILGIFPGLGAVYNGQYVKGFIHVIIFGLLMSIADGTHSEALMVPIVALFFFYMPIEAVRTARAMRRGEQVDELSGVAGPLLREGSRSPVVGVALILFGVFTLLLNLGIFRFQDIQPYWPVILIIFGAYQLYQALKRSGWVQESTPSAGSETSEG